MLAYSSVDVLTWYSAPIPAITKLLLLLMFCNKVGTPALDNPLRPDAAPSKYSTLTPGIIINLLLMRKIFSANTAAFFESKETSVGY